ncbi:hypothetical protein [Capillimicrobium parvum]|uniref:hypothetical protein n=1 Tax=Capillimicrobium parvum TaxID=2884022 RepID=UPI00216B1F11|nr:hypothetical protein [Capillimicrobium parvum]
MEGGEDFADTPRTMGEQAAETERRTGALVSRRQEDRDPRAGPEDERPRPSR